MSDGPRQLRVLVVDDNADAAAMLAMIIRMDGHVVRSATDGPGALSAVRADPADVVLCDISMPGMDGYAVARELRSWPTTGRLTLVALTGHGGPEDREKSRSAGFDWHLVKPVDPAEIEALLRDLARAARG